MTPAKVGEAEVDAEPDAVVGEPRRRSAEDSRQRLLAAASELFTERGYERATIRDIGQRAGVDSTLIARYFAGKAGLYLAALRRDADEPGASPLDITDPVAIERLVNRIGSARPSPVLSAVLRPHADPDLQAAAMAIIEQRLLVPAEASAAAQPESQLRAEIAVAALAGVMLSRTSQTLPLVAAAAPAELSALIAQLLAGVLLV